LYSFSAMRKYATRFEPVQPSLLGRANYSSAHTRVCVNESGTS
jgi:hypothetical protein